MENLTLSEFGARIEDEEKKTFGRVLESDPAVLQRRNADLEIAIILMKDAVKKESAGTLRNRIKSIIERVEIR